MKTKLLFLILLTVSLTSCYYDKEDQLYNCSVDPATITYSSTVSTIFSSYGCTGCHGNVAPSAGINLSTHGGAKVVADNGRLYGAISHAQGFVPMPQGGGKMNACDIRKVKAWIDAGAPNN